MGHQQRGGAAFGPDAQHLQVHALAGDLVQRAERFVQQQHVRLQHQGAGDRRALLHAAGQFAGKGAGEPGQADQFQQLVRRPVGAAGAGPAHHIQRQCDVLPHGAPGQQRGLLEHEADGVLAPSVTGRCAADRDASAGRRQDISDQPQQRRFAAAAGPDDGHEAFGGHVQGDILQRGDRLAAALEHDRGLFDGDVSGHGLFAVMQAGGVEFVHAVADAGADLLPGAEFVGARAHLRIEFPLDPGQIDP